MPIPEQKLNYLKKYSCGTCEKTIYSNRNDVRFCSNGCRQKNYRNKLQQPLHNVVTNLNNENNNTVKENSINENHESMTTPLTKEEYQLLKTIDTLEAENKKSKSDFQNLEAKYKLDSENFQKEIESLKKEKSELEIKHTELLAKENDSIKAKEVLTVENTSLNEQLKKLNDEMSVLKHNISMVETAKVETAKKVEEESKAKADAEAEKEKNKTKGGFGIFSNW